MEDISRGIAVVTQLKNIILLIKQDIHHQCREMNLTGPQGMLVGILAHYGAMKISDLSDRMGISNSTVSGIVDRLEKQGIVERLRSKEDRRVVRVNVTSEYRAEAKIKFEIIEKRLGAVMNKATDEEVKSVFDGLEILKKLIEKSV
ncbi:MAG: putative HTH-type transcriptional regulator YusO [Firmicutes bacterium ADurb.Bin419]|nr:MAG: putative HTH-type transcriptional regulator YusO [Firmicutes bacterium ADurb.Bin419]